MTDVHAIPDAELALIQQSIATDKRLSPQLREAAAGYTLEQFRKFWGDALLIARIPDEYKSPLLRVVERVVDGDEHLFQIIRRANAGEIAPESVLHEVGHG